MMIEYQVDNLLLFSFRKISKSSKAAETDIYGVDVFLQKEHHRNGFSASE